jgi:hypothetical protein
MYHPVTTMKNDVYGVEAEKRREEKRREEKRATLNIHPSANAAEVPVIQQHYILIRYQPLPFGKAAL